MEFLSDIAGYFSTSFSMVGGALVKLSSLQMLMMVTGATFAGIVIGMLPGLTATMGVALLTTLTYSMDHDSALMILVCLYVGAIYGGSRSAILLNIPGTPASAATTLDGYPLSRAGKAGPAMGIATAGSFFGTMIGMFFLATIAPSSEVPCIDRTVSRRWCRRRSSTVLLTAAPPPSGRTPTG